MIKSFKDTNNKDTNSDSIVNPKKVQEEANEEFSLRPQHFDDFIGQTEILNNLRVLGSFDKKFMISINLVVFINAFSIHRSGLLIAWLFVLAIKFSCLFLFSMNWQQVPKRQSEFSMIILLKTIQV